jgi:DNA-3-methyladenine glycosylase I
MGRGDALLPAPEARGDKPMTDAPARCPWAGPDPLYLAYHDHEWGVPLRDERALFELLILEGFQAGLSWLTILRKRDNFRRAFEGFEPERIAGWGPERVEALLQDPGIVRNRAKIEGALRSARACLELMAEPGGFAGFLWSFVGGQPIINRFQSMAEVPAETAESRALSKELRRRGFTFCGPTIAYAFMQASGMVDDHLVSCFCHSRAAPLAACSAMSAAGSPAGS